MSDIPQVGDLQIEEDLAFQRREWVFERVAWVLIAAVLLAALAGLFGRGPLSSAVAKRQGGAVTVEYDRLVRHRAATTIYVRLAGEATTRDTVTVRLNTDYLNAVQIKGIVPEPNSSEVGTDRHSFVFRIADRGQPVTIAFDLEPEEFGSLTGRLAISGEPGLEFKQFVYP